MVEKLKWKEHLSTGARYAGIIWLTLWLTSANASAALVRQLNADYYTDWGGTNELNVANDISVSNPNGDFLANGTYWLDPFWKIVFSDNYLGIQYTWEFDLNMLTTAGPNTFLAELLKFNYGGTDFTLGWYVLNTEYYWDWEVSYDLHLTWETPEGVPEPNSFLLILLWLLWISAVSTSTWIRIILPKLAK